MRGRTEMNEVVRKNLGKLGHRAKDKVTGFEGVVTSICFDLYGCVQAVMRPSAEKDGSKIENSRVFDVARLVIDPCSEPVMAVPEFTKADIGSAKPPLE